MAIKLRATEQGVEVEVWVEGSKGWAAAEGTLYQLERVCQVLDEAGVKVVGRHHIPLPPEDFDEVKVYPRG